MKWVKGCNEYYKIYVYLWKNKFILILYCKVIFEKFGGIKKFILICIKGVKFDNFDYVVEYFKVSFKIICNWINVDDMFDCYCIK